MRILLMSVLSVWCISALANNEQIRISKGQSCIYHACVKALDEADTKAAKAAGLSLEEYRKKHVKLEDREAARKKCLNEALKTDTDNEYARECNKPIVDDSRR